MSAFSLNSVILMTVTTVVVAHAAFAGTAAASASATDDGPGSDIRLVKRDVNYDENDSESEEGFFFSITNFFGHRKHNDDDKPDFITTFDIIRLLDEKYAMKQFYCVINEDPCDAVGMRLKATIPEEINRDCERCTSTETSNIRRILNYVKKHYPEFWERVEPIYRNNKTV
uniref:Chemosensory protein gene 1 n=1 Tax=Neotoxoptera formosana TaxID=1425443 RepID=A0AA51RPD0_9HEMI|nr:chemosensory protein gene 1 [Neotoxoptera formosana]